MSKGKVKWFNSQKGYGFIQQEQGPDLFVHYSEVKGSPLSDGASVEFEVGTGRKGPCAINVKVV
ncbi:MAG: cold shock domain-containing protein [SAR324 cluster bacterium]|nr:cold shock domain-containing protein [SAR324 cluster bacterium]MBF0350194.1 cold shock domain-containing protein [SAR324 cluster bacterium]